MKIQGYMDMHTHTTFSDGAFTPDKLATFMIKKGINSLGISDHIMLHNLKELDVYKFDQYINTIRNLAFLYQKDIMIFLGLEVHACDIKVVERNIRLLSQLDYIVLEGIAMQRLDVIREMFDILEETKCRIGLAHTDLYLIYERTGTENLLSLLKEYDVF